MKRHAPAAARNRDVILDVLRDVVPPRGLLLEIASGSGEHAVHFAQALPHLQFQPTDPDPTARASVDAWRGDCGLDNVAAPLALDVRDAHWPVEAADVVVCINMIHISPWESTVGLMVGASRILEQGGILFLYGPFYVDGETAPSNVSFDQNLRARNPKWGVRELRHVQREAEGRGLVLQRWVDMPANNLSVVFAKQ